MGLRAMIAKPVCNRIERRIRHWAARPHEYQELYFQKMLAAAPQTTYGKALGVRPGMDYEAYRSRVPLVDFEDLKPYVERIMEGEQDVLWPGAPDYLVMSSGTTSGKKYIPGTRESLKAFKRATTDVFCSYVARSGRYDIWDGKTLTLTGSPELTMMGKIPSARVSGLLQHFLGWFVHWNRLPSWNTNCIPVFEQKVASILDESIGEDVRGITGLPIWLNLFFRRMHERTGKKVIEVWPRLQVMVYGGLQVAPYRAGLIEAIGKEIDFVEVFNASEGFLAFQDTFDESGMLLHMNSGFFYEFIPVDEYREGHTRRVRLQEVELGVEYGMVLNSVGGLWGYNLGDIVRFTSLEPYRVTFSGRLAHFTSAFNEHVIQHEVERAIGRAMEQEGGMVSEFTVAPQIHPPAGEAPYHEWLVEFSEMPADLEAFRSRMEDEMKAGNHLYRELVAAGAMQPLVLSLLAQDSFLAYMKSLNKLGGQYKVPRLKNDRSIADALQPFVTQQIS